MQLDDKLTKDVIDDRNARVRRVNAAEEDEETYMYDVRKPVEFINEGIHGVFDITQQSGINTQKSVFDRQASFRTGGR